MASLSSPNRLDALEGDPLLDNDFVVLRHGQSEANVAGVIASNPEIACARYGLSVTGIVQAAAAGQRIVELYHRGPKENAKPESVYQGLAVVASDFRRARETAEAVQQAAVAAGDISLYQQDDDDDGDRGSGGVVLDVRLRERGFGAWDGGSDTNYRTVWEDDRLDSAHTVNGVESVDSVMRRVTACVQEWNDRLRNYLIVLVAHGDVLQILQTAFLRLPGTQHRSVEHLETATVRALVLK